MPLIFCNTCQFEYPCSGVHYQCPQCGGTFDFSAPPSFEPRKTNSGLPGIWRYIDSFGLDKDAPVISLGEGNTPLVFQEYQEKKVGFKLEFLNPTGSHKDRATAVLASHLKQRGITQAVEDSSGNAGASFAAYAAYSEIYSKIVMPESASGPKKKQIESYGAETVTIPGPRSASAEAVLQYAAHGWTYASHAYIPFGINGLATIAYEIWEELGQVPGSVLIPAGHGSLALGIVRGFRALAEGQLTQSVPFYGIVQPQRCAPICAEASNKTTVQNQTAIQSIAEGTSVSKPVRGSALIREILPDQGLFIAIEEEQILNAYHELAKRGFYVEPTSALVWSAFKQYIHLFPEPVILILTGSGLKT